MRVSEGAMSGGKPGFEIHMSRDKLADSTGASKYPFQRLPLIIEWCFISHQLAHPANSTSKP